MKKNQKFFVLLFWAALALGLNACAKSPTSVSAVIHRGEFTVTDADSTIQHDSISPGPKELIQRGAAAWFAKTYDQSGDFLRLAYTAGTERGWHWQSDSKTRLLSCALRAYHLAGSVEKEKTLARFMLNEMDIYDRALLSRVDKVLLYWSTSSEENPAFENEIPPSLRITAFVR